MNQELSRQFDALEKSMQETVEQQAEIILSRWPMREDGGITAFTEDLAYLCHRYGPFALRRACQEARFESEYRPTMKLLKEKCARYSDNVAIVKGPTCAVCRGAKLIPRVEGKKSYAEPCTACGPPSWLADSLRHNEQLMKDLGG